ncbi:glycoprotein2 [Hyphodiscus hymeniophilus]|uniref:Guanine nucleotide-binding protein alpha-2 subunit n=1 Tax=Hyphodiscus hymeniophilus TaxID=353542 RepID=A0A9P6VSV1_9HELO|nr:glycoprotein2 [Hyphodiscus hymeniophilus]
MCFGGREDVDAKKSRDIDALIHRDEKTFQRQVKLLLLGAGESGKSTILKQMRLIYTKDGFTQTEKEEWRIIIFNNILDGLRMTVDAMEEYSIHFEYENTTVHLPTIMQDKDLSPYEPIPVEYLRAFKDLWKDPGVQKAIARGNEFALFDNLEYFFLDLERLFSKDFIPTDQDVLRARLRTTGITETNFDLGSLQYRMFDVGGQRSERKKWIHCFENVNALLFLVAISGYDQCLAEDKDGNQMQEALMLWESIANSHWFKNSALILFLNKIDLFKAKVAQSPITKFGFSDFQGDTTSWQQTSKYFMDKFIALNRTPAREIYGHFTNATDTDLLKVTMSSVQDMIIQRNLQKLIL